MLGRVLAALSYFGLVGVVIPLAEPDNVFVVRHARRGVSLHLLRIALVTPFLAVPLADPYIGRSPDTLLAFATNLSLLAVIGVPHLDVLRGEASLWILSALIVTWGLQFLGFVLAASGLTVDVHAFLHADWPNESPRGQRPSFGRHRDEALGRGRTDWNRNDKVSLTQLREDRLDRMRAADTIAARERQRHHSLGELQDNFTELTAHRAHLTKLFELGEITERRYHEQLRHCESRLSELATKIAIFGARRISSAELDLSRQQRSLPTDLIVHVPVQMLAISARSGIPLLTYGSFQLDEALVTGILSAFNSISEEVFGAEVHKTQLAEGQVLSFVHAQYTITMAVFDEEPSPVQYQLLRDLVDQFERINAEELQRPAPNPARLHEVEIPFSFVEALS